MQIAKNEGHKSDVWWQIRSSLGTEARSTNYENILDDNNQFKYLFNLATGNHNVENREGVEAWARSELNNMFEMSFKLKQATDNFIGGIGFVGRARSLIKAETSLVTAAKKMGKDEKIQKEVNELVKKFLNGNTNPGLGTKNLFGNINYLRGREGARVFYRMKDDKMIILAKSSKANEQEVINILKKLYK